MELGIIKVVPDIRDLHGGDPDFNDVLVGAHESIRKVGRGIHEVVAETAVDTDNMLSEIVRVDDIVQRIDLISFRVLHMILLSHMFYNRYLIRLVSNIYYCIDNRTVHIN